MRRKEILNAIEQLKSTLQRIDRVKISDIMGCSQKTVGNHWDERLQLIVDIHNDTIGYSSFNSGISGEEFRNIPGIPGYQASNFGRIASVMKKSPKILKQTMGRSGYYQVSITDKIKGSRTVHGFVARAFLNHVPDGLNMVVDHINGIKTDNRLENLRIVTIRENTSLGYDKKLTTSKYRGVYFRSSRNKWVAHIRINSIRIHLGHYLTEEEAHEAYQKALSELNQTKPS